MKKIFSFTIVVYFALNSMTFAATTQKCPTDDLSSVLSCYLQKADQILNPQVLVDKKYDTANQVTIATYNLTSQVWPQATSSPIWQHTMVVYKPDTVSSKTALLYINGGTRNPLPDSDQNPAPQSLNFTKIAKLTHTIVVDLQDVPNQYLTFADNVPRKEDAIVAYTWAQYLNDTKQGQYWPLYLPMTKAVVKAMDATQQLMQKENIDISNFVLSGASKRGWTTWLTAVSDDRVSAIVPVVIDILNVKANIDLIYESYNHQWPIALHDYVEAGLPARFDSEEFAMLTKIVDPISYLNCADCDIYKTRLSIPKYIISASGDDFFVPDSMNLYFSKLPGINRVRVVPNQPHYISAQIIEDSLLTYYSAFLTGEKLPTVRWSTNNLGTIEYINTDTRATKAVIWEAVNPNSRDFRYNANVRYQSKPIQGVCIAKHCQYKAFVTPPSQGYKANFVELTFTKKNGEAITLTTSTYIIGAQK